MHQLPRGKSSELAARSSAANPQIPLALAKQLKLLLGAKSNIFQVLNKHTIKMPNAQRRPHHTHSTYPSMAHTRREKRLIQWYFSRFIYIRQDAHHEELFLFIQKIIMGVRSPLWNRENSLAAPPEVSGSLRTCLDGRMLREEETVNGSQESGMKIT